MRKALQFAVFGILIAVLTGVGMSVAGETRKSEAAELDQSVRIVQHQTTRMTVTLSETKAVLDPEVSGITSIGALITEWTPRYDASRSAFHRFDAAIEAAEARAEAYFVSQRALTDRFHDEQQRAKATVRDNTEYALYLEWRGRAHQARAKAEGVLERLDDMDTDLQKLKLSSELSFDAAAFNDVPTEITALETDLAQFQIASENIREVTGNPFALEQ